MRAPDYWQSGPTSAIGHLLSPLGAVYAMATSLRASGRPSWVAPVPVICLGNIVMGGAGKTLVGTHLVRAFIEMGRCPHVIIRGYAGSLDGPTQVDVNTHTHRDVGDEALLYGAIAPTWVGSDRVASAKCATDAGADVIIMDDGFQNPSLAKSLSILVFDGNYGIGNGYGFPAGPLREFLSPGLKRADGIVGIGQLPQSILTASQGKPIFIADTVPVSGHESLQGKHVVAFAGIGRPEKFFDSVSAAGAEIVHSVTFPDHHNYSDKEIRNLKTEAETKSAILVTTAKDHVRLNAEMKRAVTAFHVDIKWQNKSAFVDFIASDLQMGEAHA